MKDVPIPPLDVVDAIDVDEIIEAEIAAEELIAADPTYVPAKPRFVVDGVGKADWAMRILNGAHKQRDGVREQAEAWRSEIRERLARVAAWEADQLREPERTIAFMSNHLERFAIAERERTDGKTKTIKLPSGKITTRRAEEPKVNIADPDALLAWVKANVDADKIEQVVKTTESVLISEFRKLVTIEPQYQAVVDDDGGLVHDTDGEVILEIVSWVVIDEAGCPVDGVTIEHPHTEATVVPG